MQASVRGSCLLPSRTRVSKRGGGANPQNRLPKKQRVTVQRDILPTTENVGRFPDDTAGPSRAEAVGGQTREALRTAVPE